MKNIELLAPAGTYEKMVTAFKFGADAVYFAGKNSGFVRLLAILTTTKSKPL